MTIIPELLSPAGDWECLRAAVANGADAVYFGLPRFNARMRAENFTHEELPEVVAFLHNHGVKAYVTLNVLIFTDELPDAIDELQALCSAGVDAVIIQDAGLADIARRMFPQLRVHASTQMTITSPEGVRFAQDLGIQQVVLARELSLRELEKFPPILPLEVFVHGALCVAYSGQCLTSEALGHRSANRGECAQACRMPYELIVDGALRDLGDKRYLLSPQDLAAIREIPALVQRGIASFKIEGRLKSPEYVAAITAVYRKAIDTALADENSTFSHDDWYRLEMTFSRGLFSGWMHGVNHQKLVGARYGKKRGAFLGKIRRAGRNYVEIENPAVPIKPGDGVVFDTGGDTENEQGGRIFRISGTQLFFEAGKLNSATLPPGTRVWKTDDPALNRELRKSFSGKITARRKSLQPLDIKVNGSAGKPLRLECGKHAVDSNIMLDAAHNHPLTTESLRKQFEKLHDTPFTLGTLDNQLKGDVILPLSELNRMRRELIFKLTKPRNAAAKITLDEILDFEIPPPPPDFQLAVLCRSDEQVGAALESGIRQIYADYEDIRRYRDAVTQVRSQGNSQIFLATPRIQKAGEEGFFKIIEKAEPDGVLIRNIGGIFHFATSKLRKIGDFSLNVANPVTAAVFHRYGLERLTISHDLNVSQILALVRKTPAAWLELTLHHHMPLFHMEHCVFAAFLSQGTDYTNCGRPCEKHRVHLRDRVGKEHPLRADVGCRNTLFNAIPQSGASFFAGFAAAGLRNFRIELLEESAEETRHIIASYQKLIAGRTKGTQLWRELNAINQVGVTRGTYEEAAPVRTP